jgi:uncharacterized Zn-binding protein involved in type VI secretion
MSKPAAKKGDMIVATDIHIVMVQAGTATVPTPVPHPFSGIIDDNLSSDVNVMGNPAATVDSTATNIPSHIPQGGAFQNPPSNKGTIKMGSTTVTINGKSAARNGDLAQTCNDPTDAPVGTVIALGTVMIGG